MVAGVSPQRRTGSTASPDHDGANFLALAALPALVGILTTLPGVPAVMTPLSHALAEASGLPVEAVLALQVVGFSTPLVLYQSPPLVVSLHLAKQSAGPLVRFWLALSVLTVTVLWPLDYAWLRLMGVLS